MAIGPNRCESFQIPFDVSNRVRVLTLSGKPIPQLQCVIQPLALERRLPVWRHWA